MKATAALFFVLVAGGQLKKPTPAATVTPAPQATPTPTAEVALLAAQQSLAEGWVKEKLEDPSSYQRIEWTRHEVWFPGTAAAHALRNQGLRPCKEAPGYTIWELRYRAKNGYGGYTLDQEHFFFRTTVTGEAVLGRDVTQVGTAMGLPPSGFGTKRDSSECRP